jgi:hypothetical protein
MSDASYFACLGASIVAAMVVPIAIRRGIKCPESSATMSVFAGFNAAIGFVCSLPFGRTIEMPWFPYVAAVYFGGLMISLLIYTRFRSRPMQTTRSSVDRV